MQDERGKDEFSTQNQMKKHERVHADINQYADKVRALAARARTFVDERSPLSEQIVTRQAQIEKLYAGLQELCKERRARLDETQQLYGLHREIDDLLQWIADKEVGGAANGGAERRFLQVVACSPESGADYEHVSRRFCDNFILCNRGFQVQMLQERFAQFARDTEVCSRRRHRDGGDAAFCSRLAASAWRAPTPTATI